jgi:hypothetical protein
MTGLQFHRGERQRGREGNADLSANVPELHIASMARCQFEAVNNGWPSVSLISVAHIFLMPATTGAGIGT